MWRIEKLKKEVWLTFSDGTRLKGYLFLSRVSKAHMGPETVAELLEDDKCFLPFQLEGGEVALVRKDRLVFLRLDERELDRDLPHLKPLGVKIHFTTGAFLEGEVFLDLPMSHSRLSDFFNSARDFFYLEEGNRQYLVNARYVTWVQPHQP